MFVEKLEIVEAEIRGAMEGRIEEFVGGEREEEEEGGREVVDEIGEGDGEQKEELMRNEIENLNSFNKNNSDNSDEDDPNNSDTPSRPVLRVGCNCALGHHRSVAFVCELAARPWPKSWEIKVVHRDLGKKKIGGKREGQRAGWVRKRVDGFGDGDGDGDGEG